MKSDEQSRLRQPDDLPRKRNADILRVLNFFRNSYRLLLVAFLALATILAILVLPRPLLAAVLSVLLAERTLVVLLLLFSVLTLSLLWAAGERADLSVFMYFNQHNLRNSLLDRLMWLTTQFGNGVFGFILGVILWFSGLRLLSAEILLGTLTLWLVVETFKALTARTRPYQAHEQTRLVGWKERGRSFPSGHTSQVFFLASVAVNYFQFGLLGGFALYGLAALVGFTRVYIGVHYPRDVIGGAILGSVWGIIGALINAYLLGR